MTKSPITSRSRSGSPRSGADAPPAKKPKPGAAPDAGAGDAPREPAPSVASSEQVVEQPSATPGLFRRVQRGAALVREYDVEAGTTSGRAAHALALTLARSFRAELHGARVVEVGASDGCAGLNAAKLGASAVFFTDDHPESVAALRVDAMYNGVVAKAAALDWEWGAPLPKRIAASGVDIVLGSDLLFSPWECTRLGVGLDALAVLNPKLRFLFAATRDPNLRLMEDACLAALEERGWAKRSLRMSPDDAKALEPDDPASLPEGATIALWEFTKA